MQGCDISRYKHGRMYDRTRSKPINQILFNLTVIGGDIQLGLILPISPRAASLARALKDPWREHCPGNTRNPNEEYL